MPGMDPTDAILQSTARKAFADLGEGTWTTVYKSWRDGNDSGATFSAFAPVAYRPKAMAENSWDLSIGNGLPGFMQSNRSGRKRTTYLRFGDDSGVEPLVIVQEFYGVR